MSNELDTVREIAVTVACEAGKLITARRAQGVQVAASKSTLTDVVTQADQESETFIRAYLSDVFPNDAFFGEEYGYEPCSSGRTWVVDPIDGTTNYLYNIPQYAVSVAVGEGNPNDATWCTLAGAVVNPSSGEVFAAARGQGATRNGVPIHLTDAPPPLDQALLATGFSYVAEMRTQQVRNLQHLIGKVRDIRRMGAAALDLCAVACGRVDVYFKQGLHVWDYAAGWLIAQEAGAQVGGLGDQLPDEALVVAAHPELFEHFNPLVQLLLSDSGS